MVSWSLLPPEMKRHVANKLDFMSRHSLRNTSHLDRQIVNSTNFNVPRVRFGHKKSKCLIVIYTGIDEFLRLELSSCDQGTVIHRSENSWDSEKFCSTFVPSSAPLPLGISILKSLLEHKSIVIGAMEFDIGRKGEIEDKMMANLLFKLLDGAKFRVKEMVCTLNSIVGMTSLMRNWNCAKDLINYRLICLIISTDNLVPVMSRDIVVWKNGMKNYVTQISMWNDSASNESFLTGHEMSWNVIPDQVLQIASVQSPYFINFERPISVDIKDGFKRMEDNVSVKYSYATECGHWTNVMNKKNENQLKRLIGTQKCGLGLLCKQCCNPFDYWYYQTLPRRILYEPFLDTLIWPATTPHEHLLLLERVRANLDNNEKEMKKIKKIQKDITSSWGFRRVSIEDSEDVSSSESSENEENEDLENECSTKSEDHEDVGSSILQKFHCYIFTILFPVLLSIIFYFLNSHWSSFST